MAPDLTTRESTEERADSCRAGVWIESNGSEVGRLDLFLFDAEGLRQLESHSSTYQRTNHQLELRSTGGEKIAVAIANSPYAFDTVALQRYEAVEQIRFNLTDDSPSCPIMSGVCQFSVPGDCCIKLEPLLCSVTLDEVSNNLAGYELLENPRIMLTGLNPWAEVMRESGFRPAEDCSDTLRASLPCDVGFYTQRPGTTLYCYPNETPENSLGSQRTKLTFECEIRDTTRRFPVPLPPLQRGCSVHVALTVNESDDYRYEVY